jgi:hypothetical protein
MYLLTNFYYFIFSKSLGGEEAAALMDKTGLITTNMNAKRETSEYISAELEQNGCK